jgi:hypothetical protein
MRLVAVSIVKNEADIIEAFVRHTQAWVDHHLVFDHDSTDGTREILQALRAEGLPLTLYTDDAIGKLQQFRSNHLSRLAARELAADWIIPLDADELLAGPDRTALEHALTAAAPGMSRSLPLLNYVATATDAAEEANPAVRLQYCETGPLHTRKVMVPRALALDESVAAGMGSHALFRGETPLPDQPLPDSFHLAHLPLRSPQHQVLRVVLAELQKLSHGRAHAGVDTHYRLGFQLLAENPDRFFAATRQASATLRHQPIAYRGTPLRHSAGTAGWNRVARALLPYLEKLAASHGRLVDRVAAGDDKPDAAPIIRELRPQEGAPVRAAGAADILSGFTVREGLGGREGPFPPAFLPPFHWGYAPQTRLEVMATAAGPVQLAAEVLTYSANQAITVEVNGTVVHQLALPRINQKEALQVSLPLSAGRNEVTLRYATHLASPHDPRKLAVIFLSLRVLPVAGASS